MAVLTGQHGPVSPEVRPPTRAEAASGWARVVAVLRANLSLLLLLGLGVGVLGLAVAGAEEVYASVVDADDLATLDRPALDLALGRRSPGLDTAVTAYTDLGGPVLAPLLTLLLVLGLAVLWRSWTPVVLMVAAAAGSLALTAVGKVVVGRERPPTDLAVAPFETSPAFPSGHALNATVIAGVIAYLVLLRVRSRVGRSLVVVAAVAHPVLMGLSRVYLGHHWLTDVMVAWCLGLGWLAVVLTVHQLLLRRLGHDDPDRGAVATAAR